MLLDSCAQMHLAHNSQQLAYKMHSDTGSGISGTFHLHVCMLTLVVYTESTWLCTTHSASHD